MYVGAHTMVKAQLRTKVRLYIKLEKNEANRLMMTAVVVAFAWTHFAVFLKQKTNFTNNDK